MTFGPHGIRGEAHRTLVAGLRSMICSGHPLASQAGQMVLVRGGNAFDAALAVAAALGVVEPNMSGLGGDGFIMMREGASGRIRVLNATGPAPRRATRDAYSPDGIPMKGIRSVSVPGLVAGWLRAHAAGGRLSVAECFAPAVELAERGFPVSRKLARSIAEDPALAEFPSSRAIFTRDGRPLEAGEILIQRDLGTSLRLLAEEGDAAFYRGALARAITATSERYAGLLSADDLAAFEPVWQDPISVEYRGFSVYEAPPNSSGHVLLQMLNLVEGFDLAGLGPNSAEAIHLMVEAKKLAFADREAFLADPNYVEIPLDGLLAKDYARERARSIDLGRAAVDVKAGQPWGYQSRRPSPRLPEAKEDTTCFVVVDDEGNAVSQLQSIQSSFGSGLVAEGTGILLNNRMTYWHLDPSHVDCLEPGKRVRHTMNPVMVTRGNDLILVCGTPGADTQVQTNLQVVTHVLDHGFSVVEAVEAPRWRHLQDGTESTIPHNCTDELLLERRFVREVAEELRRRGQPVRLIGDWDATGSEMMIQVDPKSGARYGGADPRRDGYAIGW